MRKPVQKKMVLTGGPSSGKTTSMPYIAEKMEDAGVSVVGLPEVATFIIGSGLRPWKLPKNKIVPFQDLILKTQMRFEDDIFNRAMDIKGGDKRLIICDRGCMDNAAYMSEEEFAELLRRNKLKVVDLCERRYDAVMHLVTAANGAEAFYSLENAARTETPEQARALDIRTQEAWIGHPYLRVVDNSTDFKGKMKRLLNHVRKEMGIPVSVEIERKFLVRSGFNPTSIPVPYRTAEIEQWYVEDSSGNEVRVRRRSRADGDVFYKTIKRDTESPLTRVETEEFITEADFYRALSRVKPGYRKILKRRTCFLWKNQYFELDVFEEPASRKGLTLLEIELTEENDRVEIPDWLGVVKEVTEDGRYKNSVIAQA